MVNLSLTDEQFSVFSALCARVRYGGTTLYADAFQKFLIDNEELLDSYPWQEVKIKFKKESPKGIREIVILN